MSSPKKTSSQRERFIGAARELETDDSPEEFERVFAKVVKAKKPGERAAPRDTERKK